MFTNHVEEFCDVKTMLCNCIVLVICLKQQEKWDCTMTFQEILHILNKILGEFYTLPYLMNVEFVPLIRTNWIKMGPTDYVIYIC